MESQGCNECLSDFGFAFNNDKFSDRTIQLNIITELTNPINTTLANWVPNNKRCRLHGTQNNALTKTIHISTVILAAKSPFFYKLFSNGMAESSQHHVTLQIHESEEAAFVDMLKFMYTNTLSESRPIALLDVLMAADKYEVASCMKYCCQSLHKLPMTFESALLYLDIPSTLLMGDTFQSLKDAAKEFLVACLKDISKFQREMFRLPLVGVEAVLSSDDLQVSSEDEIYDFVITWTRINSIKMTSDQRKLVITRLLRLIRFQYLSRSKLEEVLSCTLISLEYRSKLVFDALSHETPYRQLPPVKKHERAYTLRPVKVIRFDYPREKCVIYLDLKHEECARLSPNDYISSQPFDLAGQTFCLKGQRHMDGHILLHSFGLFLTTQDKGLLGVQFKFSSRKKPSEKFVGKYKGDYDFPEADGFGYFDLFEEPWERFIADDSPYFIKGILHLRAVLKIKKEV